MVPGVGWIIIDTPCPFILMDTFNRKDQKSTEFIHGHIATGPLKKRALIGFRSIQIKFQHVYEYHSMPKNVSAEAYGNGVGSYGISSFLQGRN